MPGHRSFVVAAFLNAVCALVGLGALASGAATPYGTSTEAERTVALVASGAGLVLGALLLAVSALRVSVVGRAAAAAGAFLAALAMSIPAAQAFATRVNTPADDSQGCGSLSTPTKQLQPGTSRATVTDTCRDRLNLQKLLVTALILPSVGAAGTGLAVGLRTRPRQEDGA